MNTLFLNLPLFDDVLEYHYDVILKNNIDKLIACGLVGSRCETNMTGNKLICSHCKCKARAFALNVNKDIIFIENSHNKDFSNSNISFEETTENFLISLYRDQKYNNSSNVKKYKFHLRNYCNNLERNINTYLKKNKVHCMYFFNSRFPSGAAAKIASKENNISYVNYDLLAKKRITLSRDSAVLDPQSLLENVNNELKNIPKKDIIDFGKKFIYSKLNNKFIAYEVFTKNQNLGTLPDNLGSRYCVVFTSSEDEYKYYGSDLSFDLIDQFEEISFLIDHLEENISIVVRLHPNQSGSEFEKKCLNKLRRENGILKIIEGSSVISTYSLMQNSLINITFGSSTAVESILLKQRSVLIGRSIYDHVVKIPIFQSIEHLLQDKYYLFENIPITKYEMYQAARWVSYVSGGFKNNNFSNNNIKFIISKNSIKWWAMDKYWRLVRLMSYPKPIVYKKSKKFIKGFFK